MNKYIKNLTPSGNAKDSQGRVWLVQAQPATFRFPYAGWNKGGTDTTKAETLAAAIAAFGLTAYTAPVVSRRLVERTPLYVRRWFRAAGKEAQYDALIAALTPMQAADYREAVAFAWDDAAIVAIRSSPEALALLGMTEAELRAIFEE